MEEVYRFIKRLLVFFICASIAYFSGIYIKLYISIPILVLAFSLLHSRSDDELPPHLFAFDRTDSYFSKGGARSFLHIFVTIFGFIHNTIIWTLWGVFLVYKLFLDGIDLIKNALYWLIRGILWLLRQYLPCLVFFYRICSIYLIRWTWWLYRIAFFSLLNCFTRIYYRLALIGTLLASMVIFVFYFLEIMLENIPGIRYIGFIFALLPLTWSLAEIAAVSMRKTSKEPYKVVKIGFGNGIEAVRSILFYITCFVVLLLIQLGLNLTSWNAEAGIPVAGFLFNINTFISILLFLLIILTVPGVFILPSYRLYFPFSEFSIQDNISFLKVIGKKFLQYIAVTVPASIFSAAIVVIPITVLLSAGLVTFGLKNFVTDIRINSIRTRQVETSDKLEAYRFGKRIDLLESFRRFPYDLPQEMEHRKDLLTEIAISNEDLQAADEERLRTLSEMENSRELLQNELQKLRISDPASSRKDSLVTQIKYRQDQQKKFQEAKTLEIEKLKIHIDYLMHRNRQIPLMFFLSGLWFAFFGAFALALPVAYLGNVCYNVFVFRNNSSRSVWSEITEKMQSEDKNQPLLSVTLTFLTIVIVYLSLHETGIVSRYFRLFIALFHP